MRAVTRGGAVLVLVTFLLAFTGVAGASPRNVEPAARSAAARREARQDASERAAAQDPKNRDAAKRDAADRGGDHEEGATPAAQPPTAPEVAPPPPPAVFPAAAPAVALGVTPATASGVTPATALGVAPATALGVAPAALLVSDLAVVADPAPSLPGAPANPRPAARRVLQPAAAPPHRGWANRAAAQAPWDLSLGALGPLSSALGVEPMRAGVHNAAPIGLGGLVLVFLLIQAQIDKRDPRLTRAPVRRDDDGMCFT